MSGAPGLLGTIVAATRTSVAHRQSVRPIDRIMDGVSRQPRGDAFEAALRSSGAPRIVAECKRRSPSRGILRRDYDPVSHASAYARAGAAAISVLTEPTFFDGSLEHLAAVRTAIDLPLLRKDFIVSDYQVYEAAAAGADAILLIVSALDDAALRMLLARARSLSLAALVEVHDTLELARAVDGGATVIGVNSRNLRTLAVDLGILDAMARSIPRGVVSVAESGIRSGDDVRRLAAAGFDALLIGERLMTEPDPGEALTRLLAS